METPNERISVEFCAEHLSQSRKIVELGEQVSFSFKNYNQLLIFSKWNPHAFVYDLLSNKYNKNYDLIGLVNYLVNTDRVMESILYFSNTELRSLKAYSILTNSDDRNAPLELKVNIWNITLKIHRFSPTLLHCRRTTCACVMVL